MNKHRVDERTWWLIFFFTLILLVLVLCGISFGATGPQDYIERRFARNSPLSEASRYLGSGDQIRCFNVSLSDTTANGVDASYVGGYFSLFRMSLPDSGAICDCYKTNGSPDSLVFHGFIPGRGFKVASAQWSTNAQGRIDFNRSLAADSVVVAERLTTADLATGAGTIGNAELANDAVDASKIAADAVGTSEISNGAILNADINGSAAIALTKLDNNSASANDVLVSNGTNWTKASTLATPVSTTTVTTSSTLTANGNVTLGDASGDAITITGTPTITPQLTLNGGFAMASDSTKLARINGRLDLDPFVYKEFSFSGAGGTAQTFTWTGAKPSWRFLGFWIGDPSTCRPIAVYYSGANQITAEVITGAIACDFGVICIRPTY